MRPLGIALLAISTIGFPHEGWSSERPPFSIDNEIAFTRIESIFVGTDESVQWSPGRSHFFFVTTTGDLKNNTVVYKLWCGRADALIGSGGAKGLSVVVTVRGKRNLPGISLPRWVGDAQITYLTAEGDHVAELYIIGVDGRTTRLAHCDMDITDYAISADGRAVLYEAKNPPPAIDKISNGIVAGSNGLLRLYSPAMRFPLFAESGYFVSDLAAGETRALQLPPHVYFELNPARQLSISPRGKWAIVLTGNTSDDTRAPYSSTDYLFPKYLLVNTGFQDCKLERSIDLHLEGSERTGFSRVSAGWSLDENELFVALAHTPLASGPNYRVGRSIIIRELNLSTHVFAPVANLAADLPDIRFLGVSRNALSIEWAKGGQTVVSRFLKQDGSWRTVGRPEEEPHSQWKVFIRQDINTPPDLYAEWPGSTGAVRITDLNPQLKEVELGNAEVFSWHDSSGQERQGALLKPRSFSPGRRYPLVIQTHGYSPGEFWLNGRTSGMTSGYSARTLSGRGLMVLQVPDDYSMMGTPNEIPQNVMLISGAIQELVKEGLIDPRRIGIHGSSRSGFVVQGALFANAFSIAAASVAEADEVSRNEYIGFFGANGPSSMNGLEKMWGLPSLFGDSSASSWAQGDPTNHLDRIHAPLLIEAYRNGIAEWWDTYAILRRNSRPVEYIYFPDAFHVPIKPVERLVAQGSVVDWYDFWLNDHEDPDPKKAEQYARWHKLRELHEADLKKWHEEQLSAPSNTTPSLPKIS